MADISLKGSDRTAMPGARVLAPAAPSERLEVTILVRRGDGAGLAARVAAIRAGGPTAPYLSRSEFARRHGAQASDLAAVRKFAGAQGLAVVQEDAARRTVVLSGTVAQFNAAFRVQLQQMAHAGGTYRGRTGAIMLPSELDGIVEAVLGLDSRPQASPHFRLAAGGADVSFTPIQVAAAYGFPSGTGEGECVALIELGGGFRPADLTVYFKGLGVGSPSVTAVSVDHALNARRAMRTVRTAKSCSISKSSGQSPRRPR